MMVRLTEFTILGDTRGSLIALEENKNIPFDIKRVYYIYGTKKNIRRGCHAHKQLNQVAVCVKGSCTILLDDANEKKTVVLDMPNKGLIIHEMIWHEMYDFSNDCVLMLIASELYDESDYIRKYEEFIKLVKL